MTKVRAWQHVYYHLSLSDSDRLMLLVHMLPKFILFFCGAYRSLVHTCSDMYCFLLPKVIFSRSLGGAEAEPRRSGGGTTMY